MGPTFPTCDQRASVALSLVSASDRFCECLALARKLPHTEPEGTMWRFSLLVVLAVLVVMQAVPYGANQTNPPVRVEPGWDSERTRRLTARVCFDCHSNETAWPWISRIAPFSWLIQHDVEQGRRIVNFSEWDRRQPDALGSAAAVRSGQMPPSRYDWLRPARRLSAAEREELVGGLDATLGPRRAGTKGRGIGGIAITQ